MNDDTRNSVRPNPIIFLDIDGVLNRTKHATHIRLDDDLMVKFKRLVLETNACIVLSTFWRYFQDYISYILDRHGIPKEKVIGSTPGYNRSMFGRNAADEGEYKCRAEEIRAWLKENPGHDERFVILDDRLSAVDDTFFLKDRFVFCDTERGLTDDDVDKAISILSS